MSDPIDIKALDEYLKGGSEISQRYRELGREDVPPELDRRVLDEARAAVAGGGRSRSWLRWGAPVALAASVVLAVAVVIESGVQNDASFANQPVPLPKARTQPQPQPQPQLEEESKLQEQIAQPQQDRREQFAAEPPAAIIPQAPPAAAPPSGALDQVEAQRANEVAPPQKVRADAQRLRDEIVTTTPIATSAATIDSPEPQLAAEQTSEQTVASARGSIAGIPARKEASAPVEADASDDDVSSVSVTGTRTRRTGRIGPRGTGAALSSETRPAADEEAAADVMQADPQKWLERIRELRRAGKAFEADRAWQQFRKAYPDFPVADDDLARQQR